ncbi:MAG: hypothetical protein KBT46_05600 [Ruminococcus sp.]|nr:hypothetical protein [Candidatus Copronaster equi]
MLIVPNSELCLLMDVPLQKNYEHTISFLTAIEQENYFKRKIKYSSDNYSFIRANGNSIKVPYSAESLFDVNYIMFKNTNFGNKWFFAFVNSIDYVNNSTAEIKFEIDVIQTWLFDFELKQSFIDREHTSTDSIGGNVVPENIETGEYVYQDLGKDETFRKWVICIAATFDKNLASAVGGLYGGVYSGLYVHTFENANDANTFLERVVAQNKSGGIVSIFMFPHFYITEPTSTRIKTKLAYWNYNPPRYSPFYSVKNKKIFTYPFTFLVVADGDGHSAEFRVEDFAHTEDTTEGIEFDFAFSIQGFLSASPQIALIPYNHKNLTYNTLEQMTLDNFPQCAYNIDAFVAWLAQQKGTLTVDAFTKGASMFANAVTGNIGGVVSTAVGVAQEVAQIYDKSTLAPQAKGKSSASISIANGNFGFHFYMAHMKDKDGLRVDNYFNMYGYKINDVKIPNTRVRERWTFTKTIGCKISGAIPQDDMNQIIKIFDTGVTFWKYRDDMDIGNYNKSNNPT